jgi:mRNA-degrading endonuclease RelE of RelBE toxin-antitoxin system
MWKPASVMPLKQFEKEFRKKRGLPNRSRRDALSVPCLLAGEATEARREIQSLLFGNRKHAYRILYEVDETRETVWVLHIRHVALRDFPPCQDQ